MNYNFPNSLDLNNKVQNKKSKEKTDKKKDKSKDRKPKKEEKKNSKKSHTSQKKQKSVIKEKEFKKVNINKIKKKAKEVYVMSKKAIKYGIVGLGQGGVRIAKEFEKLGYPMIAINTSEQDLEKIDCKNKLLIGKRGAGKDLNIGKRSVTQHKNKIMTEYQKTFQDIDHALVCAGSSGGTGGGGLKTIVDTLNDFKVPVGVLTTLPLNSEDTRAKKNTLAVLNNMIKMNKVGDVKPLILIDNDKIEKKHPGLSTLEFWHTANKEVVKTFDLFNKLSATSTEYSSLDPADYTKIINSGGCMIFGNISIDNHEEIEDEDKMFSNAIMDNIDSGLLAEGFNLVESTHCGCIIVGKPDQLKEIPRRAEENAMESIMKVIGSGSVYRGVYGLEQLTHPEVFFMMSGLGLPVSRIRDLVQSVEEQTEHLKQKATHRTVDDILNDTGKNDSINLDDIDPDKNE